MGCYGHATYKTPNLDRLADSGVKFETCWATPVCSPSRAAILTGRYGFRTGWFDNDLRPHHDEPGYDLTENNLVFSWLLRRAGYATAMAGKWQLSGQWPTMIYEYGFDEYCTWGLIPGTDYDGPIEEIGMPLPGRPARYWHPAIVQNNQQLDTGPEDYGPDIFVDFVNDFVARHQDGPFFVYYPMCLTHKSWDFDLNKYTYVPTPRLDAAGHRTAGRSDNTLKSNVEYMDHLVGRIVSNLDDLEIRNETVIIFTSDNATAGYGKDALGQEKGPRVPMIVNGPGYVAPIASSMELIDFSDVLLTLADMSGLTLPDDYIVDGKSFAPVLRYEKGLRDWIFSYCGDRRFLRDKRWLLDGHGDFYDCGNRRDEIGYKKVTASTDPEVTTARKRFEEILKNLPAP